MLIILDRDGVINEYDGRYICSVDEWHPIPGSIEAVARLYKAGHRLAIATNQSGIARGFYSTDVLDAVFFKIDGTVSVLKRRLFLPHTFPDSMSLAQRARNF